MTDLAVDVQARMTELLTRFKLPTIAAEAVRRFVAAGHADALPTLLEVLEAEADERGQRKTERLLRASPNGYAPSVVLFDRAAIATEPTISSRIRC